MLVKLLEMLVQELPMLVKLLEILVQELPMLEERVIMPELTIREELVIIPEQKQEITQPELIIKVVF